MRVIIRLVCVGARCGPSVLSVEDLLDGLNYDGRLRDRRNFQAVSVRHGDVGSGHPDDGSVEVVEGRSLDHPGAHLSSHAVLPSHLRL